MSLTEEVVDYLQETPLSGILTHFCDAFKVNFNDTGDTVFENPAGEVASRRSLLNLFSRFTLYVSEGNLVLSDSKNLLPRMTRIKYWLTSTMFDLAPFEPLARLILNNGSDIEVWQCLMHLVDTLEVMIKGLTDQPQKLAAASIYRRAAGPLDRAGKTMEELKELMRHELSGSVFMNVKGFWKKYFEKPKWSRQCRALSKEYKARSGEEKLKFPEDPSEADVWRWMKAVEEEIIKSSVNTLTKSAKEKGKLARSRFMHSIEATQCHTLAKGQIEGGQTDRQLDYFIKRSNLPNDDGHHWRDVLVVGELTKLPTSAFLDKFLQLCVYMSEVFLAQPLRHFVHGFILFGTQLQLWIFDRSGPYCESIIDVRGSQEKLVHVLAAYMMMSDKEHGVDSHIRYEGDEMIIKMKVPGSNVMQEFSLDSKPLICQSALVSRGTTVYCSSDKKYVVKFSWKICGKTSEVELLKIAKDVVGMAKLIGWRDLVQTSTLRKGLIFTHRMVKCTRPAEKALTTPVVLIGNSVQYLKKSTSKAESRKRKSESEQAGDIIESVSKRTRSGTKEVPRSVPVVEIRSQPTGIVIETEKIISGNESLHIPKIPQRRSSRIEDLRMSQSVGGKRKIQEDVDFNDRLKRVHVSSHTEEVTIGENDGPSSSLGSESNHTSTTEKSEESMMSFTSDFVPSGYKIERAECVDIRKRQQAAVAISPVGKPISDFNTPLEVIIGLCDALKAHRSLFIDAKILHRDISVNNILLKICDDPKDYGGILIDLDLATLFKDGKAEGKLETMTGTMQFMALEILKNSFTVPGTVVSHSYRHDLESFFYVLVWICIRYGWPDNKSPHLDFLRKWYSGTAEEIYNNKKLQMKPEEFEKEVYERISPTFKVAQNLVLKIWKILFRKGEDITMGITFDPDTLYGPIMMAFEKAILKLKSI
ncbi:unnamed protein product [Blumeria hordei]|uniref:EKC/KEOPS complex subunit BUD32 n=1 Tax=Blumeria hordei TaxID=2867405 RepID=A0A383URW7_BLUHO|nr:unnamed protein product [Blumeria hordei]